jgi:hypothetical protein
MSVETRPTDTITPNHLLIGMPFVEFAPRSSGILQPYRNLGIVDSAELQKTLEMAQLSSAQSGVSVLVREIVKKIEARLQVGVFNFSPENMQLFLGSATLQSVAGGSVNATDEPFTLTDDPLDFIDLANRSLTVLTTVEAAPISNEAVGTGDGTKGAVSGDYALAYKVNAVGDVTSVTVGSTSYTPIAVGGATTGNQVEVAVGTGATSGNLQFFVGGVATNVTGAIVASYQPSFASVLGTNHFEDLKGGRVRVTHVATKGAGAAPFLAKQPMQATYTYTEVDHHKLAPFTQTSFEGAARVRLLTDVGINLLWTIPRVSVRLTDDAFAFSRDEFGVGTLIVNILDNGGSEPFGSIKSYAEGA